MRTAQKVGVSGIVLIAAGAIFAGLLPWARETFGGTGYTLGMGLFAVGGALLFFGIAWAWVVGLMEGARAWDEVRLPLFCPVCGERYPGGQGRMCPRDGAELKPRLGQDQPSRIRSGLSTAPPRRLSGSAIGFLVLLGFLAAVYLGLIFITSGITGVLLQVVFFAPILVVLLLLGLWWSRRLGWWRMNPEPPR